MYYHPIYLRELMLCLEVNMFVPVMATMDEIQSGAPI